MKRRKKAGGRNIFVQFSNDSENEADIPEAEVDLESTLIPPVRKRSVTA